MPGNVTIPGLDFGLGEEIDMLRDSVRGFADARVAPIAAEIDRLGLGPVKLWLGIGVGSCARRSEASSRRSPRCGSSFQSRHELL